MVPLPDRSLEMPLSTAQSFAWSMARTMMTINLSKELNQ